MLSLLAPDTVEGLAWFALTASLFRREQSIAATITLVHLLVRLLPVLANKKERQGQSKTANAAATNTSSKDTAPTNTDKISTIPSSSLKTPKGTSVSATSTTKSSTNRCGANARRPDGWRDEVEGSGCNDDDGRRNGDASGLYMSIALVPILLQSMEPRGQDSMYAVGIAMIMALVAGSGKQRQGGSNVDSARLFQLDETTTGWGIIAIAIAVAVAGAHRRWTTTTMIPFAIGPLVSLGAFVVLWWSIYTLVPSSLDTQGLVPSLRSVVTRGEWLVLSSVGAVVVTEFVTTNAAPILPQLRNILAMKNDYVTAPITSAATSNASIAVSSFAPLVAVSGVLGCAMGCTMVLHYDWTSWMLVLGLEMPLETAEGPSTTATRTPAVIVLLQVMAMIGLTLGFVEACFWIVVLGHGSDPPHYSKPETDASTTSFPLCLYWMYDFLMTPEEAPLIVVEGWDNEVVALATQQPRGAWLLYWLVVLLCTLPLAPTTNAHPVIARKWFHFVAVLLFGPVTLLAPTLMSLSYAVAVALLLLLESTRHNVPLLNAFYCTYLDSSKDECQEATIISHLALIFGCAAPLWLSQWSSTGASSTSSDGDAVSAALLVRQVLLPLWGVWVLGVGDALGAMIGKRYGRWQWGTNRRTVEGSLALFVSVSLLCHGTILVGLWCGDCNGRDMDHADTVLRLTQSIATTSWTAAVGLWLPAVLLVTILEAYTLQIDNIVLPLAGAAMLFACTMPS